MFLTDTNIFVQAAIRECPAHDQAADLVNEWASSAGPWFATWSIVYEFLRVVTHRSAFSRPLAFAEAWSFVEALRQSSSFSLLVETDRHADVLKDLVHEYPRLAGNRMHDLHIAALMREHGVREIRTADTDFHQFKFLHVVDPLE